MEKKRFIWALIPLLVILSFLSTLYRNAHVPSRSEWKTALAWVKTQWQPGDQMTWYPEWVSEGRLYMHDFNAFYPPYQGTIDLGYARRTWVLSSMGYDATDWLHNKNLSPLQKLTLVKSKSIGNIQISLLEIVKGLSEADLYQQWDQPQAVQVKRIINQQSKSCELWALEGWHCLPKQQQQRIDQCVSKSLKSKLRHKSRRRDLYTLDHRRFLPYVDCKLDPIRHVTRDARVIADEPRRCIAFTPVAKDQIEVHWHPQFTQNMIGDHPRELWLSYGWEDLVVNHPFRASRTKESELTVHVAQKKWSHHAVPKVAWHTQRYLLNRTEYQHLKTQGMTLTVKAKSSGDPDSTLCVQVSIREAI